MMGRLSSLSQVMKGQKEGQKKAVVIPLEKVPADRFHLAVKTPLSLLNKNYTHVCILDLITVLLCLCLQLFFEILQTERLKVHLFIRFNSHRHLKSFVFSHCISACHRGEQYTCGQLILVLLAYRKPRQSSFKFFLATELVYK